MESDNNRNLYWDIMRGIAMLLVVLGHASLAKESLLNRAIYAFHMPLFMIISGFFFQYSLQRHSFRENLSRKFFQLLLPVLVIGTLDFLFTAGPAGPVREMAAAYYAVLIRTLWFLQAVFLSCLAVLAVDRFIRSHTLQLLVYLALCATFLFVPDFACSTGSKFMFPCFVAGLYLNRWGLDRKYKALPGRSLAAAALAVLFCVLLHFFSFRQTFYNATVYLFSGIASPASILYDDIFRIVIGLIGSFAVMALVYEFFSRLPQHGPVSAFLGLVGRNTLVFYCIHVYLNRWWLHVFQPACPAPWYYVLLYFAATTAACLLLAQGYKFLKTFLFPRKKH